MGEAAYNQFYSLGTSADKSFAPDTTTGKRLVLVPGGPGAVVYNSTNWAYLLKSLYDCGLPKGVFSNNVGVLDGIHVQMTSIPEPAERASFGSKLNEGGEERKPGNISIVTQILDGGKPWEGTGGIPQAGAAPRVNGPAPVGQPLPRPVAGQPTMRPAAAAPLPLRPTTAPAAPAPPPQAPAAMDSSDIQNAAVNGGTAVLEKNLKGITKLSFRTSTFSAVKAAYGDDMAQAVQEVYFANDESANVLCGLLGYTIKGADVVPLS